MRKLSRASKWMTFKYLALVICSMYTARRSWHEIEMNLRGTLKHILRGTLSNRKTYSNIFKQIQIAWNFKTSIWIDLTQSSTPTSETCLIGIPVVLLASITVSNMCTVLCFSSLVKVDPHRIAVGTSGATESRSWIYSVECVSSLQHLWNWFASVFLYVSMAIWQ